jgi:branched-chain amino acid transport system permease protein
MLRGINVRAVSLFTVAGACSIAAAVGPVVGPYSYASYSLGDSLAIKAFVALAIGGFGSNSGALIGGVLVGLTEVFSTQYLGGNYSNLSILVLLILVLVFRPSGLARGARGRVL